MQGKWTAPRLRALKGRARIPVLTAYDAFTARLVEEAGLPAILVGDSVGMTLLGYETTLPVTLDEMLHHTAAVARGAKQALLITDLPFLTYQVSTALALEHAGRCLQRGADAVKIEGGEIRAATVRTLVENGIPVMGHLGLLPQHVRTMGGYKVQGRTAEEADRLLREARVLEEAGIFALVLEGMPTAAAARITQALKVPTIGIGAGSACDGQVLVVNDLLGMSNNATPRFVKRYAEVGDVMRKAFLAYKRDVEAGRFPAPENCYEA